MTPYATICSFPDDQITHTNVPTVHIILSTTRLFQIMTESTESDNRLWKQNVVLIVTGASRGFGASIVKTFIKSFFSIHSENESGLHVILTARDAHALQKIKDEYFLQISTVAGSINDEQTLDGLREKIRSECAEDQSVDQVILIHNAGTLGDPSLLSSDFDSSSMETLNEYFSVNVSSFIALTGIFLQETQSVRSRIIANISSLAAVCPLKGLSIYGAGKAARDSFIRSVAEENADVLAFNYAPGPLRTDMAHVLKTRSHMQEFFEVPSNILDPDVSASKLATLLMSGSVESGSHVDYFDDV